MHLTPEEDALVQGLFDGTLTPAEREAAERLMQKNADARRRSAELSELARLLDGLGSVEPPADFSSQVMQAITDSHGHVDINRTLKPSERRLSFGERLSQLIDGRFGMGKKVMWGLVATAAVALLVMKVVGYPPIDGAQGTVGAAKRYQADQIAPADVKVDDSAQAFVQSDVFDQLVKDPNARQLLASPSFRSALAAPEFRSALASPDFTRALLSADFRNALASPQLRAALGTAQAVNYSQLVALSPGFANALANADFAKALLNADFVRALASPDFSKALAQPGMVAALASANFAKALASPGFAKALNSPQMLGALGIVGQ